MRNLSALVVVTLVSSGAEAAEFGSWEEYLKGNRYKCPGPFDVLKSPTTLSLGGKNYRHSGFKLEVQNPDGDARVRIGLIGAIKDTTPPTKENVKETLAWFKAAGVEWVVANGDLALEEFDLEDVLDQLGQSGFPVLLVLGNAESKGSFARAYAERAKKYPNLINGVLVRQIIADDVEFWTMPGYFDRKFAHQGATCTYQEEEIKATLDALKPAGKGPLALVSHGPPRCKGKHGLDVIPTGDNKGDELLNSIISKANVPFGFFGHILEAGGRAVGKDLSTPVKPNTEASHLYVNAGALSGDPWAMLDGSSSYGMAMVITIDAAKASYELKQYAYRAAE
jgi:Icc-related predicted phosphoesterase